MALTKTRYIKTTSGKGKPSKANARRDFSNILALFSFHGEVFRNLTKPEPHFYSLF